MNKKTSCDAIDGDNPTIELAHRDKGQNTQESNTSVKHDELLVKSIIVKNKSHSLKRSILQKFLPMTFALLLFVALCALLFLYVSNRYILHETHQMLKNQYNRYGGFIVEGESASISNVLSWTGLETEAAMMSDFYRANYSIADSNQTFLGFDDLLAPPLTTDNPKHDGTTISLSHSSYIFPGMSRNELIHNLSPAQKQNRDLVSKIDYIAKDIFEVREDHFQSYFAMEEDGLFIVYPGQSLNTNGTSTHDWRHRDWYKQGKAKQLSTVVTTPYVDALSGKLVITLCRAVHHLQTGEFRGVGGVDFSLDSLESFIIPSFGLERQVVFFVSTGAVLLDSNWFKNSSADIAYQSSYDSIVNPTISEAEWASMRSTGPGQKSDIAMDNSYLCYAFRFKEPLSDFVFVSFASEHSMQEKANVLEANMAYDWRLSLYLLLVTSTVFISVSLSVFYCTVATLARDVDRAHKQINNLFHSLRLKAEQNLINDKQDARLRVTNSALGLLGLSDPCLTPDADPEKEKEKERPAQLRGLSQKNFSSSNIFTPTDTINANPFWNTKHPFLHHSEGSSRYLSRPQHAPSPSGRFGHDSKNSHKRLSEGKSSNSASLVGSSSRDEEEEEEGGEEEDSDDVDEYDDEYDEDADEYEEGGDGNERSLVVMGEHDDDSDDPSVEDRGRDIAGSKGGGGGKVSVVYDPGSDDGSSSGSIHSYKSSQDGDILFTG